MLLLWKRKATDGSANDCVKIKINNKEKQGNIFINAIIHLNIFGYFNRTVIKFF